MQVRVTLSPKWPIKIASATTQNPGQQAELWLVPGDGLALKGYFPFDGGLYRWFEFPLKQVGATDFTGSNKDLGNLYNIGATLAKGITSAFLATFTVEKLNHTAEGVGIAASTTFSIPLSSELFDDDGWEFLE